MRGEIRSPNNPLIRQGRLLREKRREREQSGLALLEGVRLAEDALRTGLPLVHFFYSADLLERERGARLLDRLQAAGVPGYRVPPALLQAVADTEAPQGIVAVFRAPRADLADLPAGLLVVCDGLQDPGNLGTLARAGEALGAAGLVAGAGTADPFSPKCVRAAMGSLFRLPVAVAPDTAAALHFLAGRGFRVVVADAGGDRLPWQVDWSGPVALVIGNEGAGPSPGARAAAATLVRIPMPGAAESLNAAVAGSLLLYEALRQRLQP